MVYGPAMHVLVEERVVEPARPHVRRLLQGQPLIWDASPLAREPWTVYAGICSAVAQVVRLFGKEVEFDQWGEQRRLTLATVSWDPLPYQFGWQLACRPFAGVQFVREPETLDPRLGLRYLSSWTHGYFTRDELSRLTPALRELVIASIIRLQRRHASGPGLDRDTLETLLLEAHKLPQGTFVDLFSLGGHDDDDVEAWTMRRALIALRAANEARAQGRDLIALGY